MEELHQLHREALEAADTSEAIVKKEIRRFFRNYIALFQGRLNELSGTERLLLGELTALVEDLEVIAIEAGFEDVITAYEDELLEVADNVQDYYERFGYERTYSGIDLGVIDILSESFIEELGLQIDDRLLRATEQAIIQSNVGLRDRRDIVEEIRSIIENEGILRRDGTEFYDHNIEVFVGDSLRRFQQFVRFERAAELNLEYSIYDGPDDEKTRKICHDLLRNTSHGVPGVWLTSEIKSSMHPDLEDQGIDPLIAKGGWNCRHDWLPISERQVDRFAYLYEKGVLDAPSSD